MGAKNDSSIHHPQKLQNCALDPCHTRMCHSMYKYAVLKRTNYLLKCNSGYCAVLTRRNEHQDSVFPDSVRSDGSRTNVIVDSKQEIFENLPGKPISGEKMKVVRVNRRDKIVNGGRRACPSDSSFIPFLFRSFEECITIAN
jgi:hypothetical protein